MKRSARIIVALVMLAVALLAFRACGQRPVVEAVGLPPPVSVPDPSVVIPLPGNPFQALPTRDGAWVVASLASTDAGKHGIAVLKRAGNHVSLERIAPLDDAPAGMVFTHDEKLLVVAASSALAFFDVERLFAGTDGALLGYLLEPRPSLRRIYVNVTQDDRYLFASDEGARTITVVDLVRARATGFDPGAIVGKIPVGDSPIALTLSPDGGFLYTTSQAMPSKVGWPAVCRPEARKRAAPDHSEGAILVIDVAKAKTEPATAVVGTIAAGCNPVRLVLSPAGDIAYVSARGSDALLAFDTKKLLSDASHALVGTVPIGHSPVGVAVFDAGRRVLVTSSNRFAADPNDSQPVFVVDATRITAGAAAVMGTIPAGAFPREMRLTADGTTLLLTNYASKSLQLVDLAHLPR